MVISSAGGSCHRSIRSTGVIELRVERQETHGLHDVYGAMHNAVDGLDGLLERQAYGGLCGQFIDMPASHY
jgi:hypothetical protein